ncbi:hypothetical protein LTR39_002181 [Cryomyces antarcticus]|nr:hypothetical protein LTR39_002181 [Cryomyces antarcticus]
MNTLDQPRRTLFDRRSKQTTYSRKTPTKSAGHALDIEEVRGDNVFPHLKPLWSTSDFEEPRVHKRQKLMDTSHHASSPRQEYVDLDDNSLAQTQGFRKVERVSAREQRDGSSISRNSQHSAIKGIDLGHFDQHEYYKVDALMSTRSKNRSRVNGRGRSQNNYPQSTSLSKHSSTMSAGRKDDSAPSPVIVVDDESSSHLVPESSMDHVTLEELRNGRSNGNPSNSSKLDELIASTQPPISQTGDAKKSHGRRASCNDDMIEISQPEMTSVRKPARLNPTPTALDSSAETNVLQGLARTGRRSRSPRLRDSFKRLVDDANVDSSLDELHGGTTIEVHNVLPSAESTLPETGRSGDGRRITVNEPSESPAKITPSSPSDISATMFQKSGRESTAMRKPAGSKKKGQDTPRFLPLEFLCHCGILYPKEADFGLEYDDSSNVFNIVTKGGITNDREQRDVHVNPRLFQRATRNASSPKIQLLGPRVPGTTDHKTYIEFAKQSDLQRFLDICMIETRTVLKVIERTEAEMDKIFENRNIERPHTAPMVGPVVDEGEMELLERRTKDHQKREASSFEQTTTKRRRQTPKISDMLAATRDGPSSPDLTKAFETKSEYWPDKTSAKKTVDASRTTRSSGRTTDAKLPQQPESPHQSGSHLRNERFSVKHGLGASWEQPLIYPATGARKTTVNFQDLERLDDGQELNDNLISFYLRYIEMSSNQAQDMAYFFDTYFYTRLTKTASGQRGFNYEAVQRWTSKVDIFKYPFVVVPINESAHWYLAIICNLPNVDQRLHLEEPAEDKKALDVPSDPEGEDEIMALTGVASRGPSASRKSSEEPSDELQISKLGQMSLENEGFDNHRAGSGIRETENSSVLAFSDEVDIPSSPRTPIASALTARGQNDAETIRTVIKSSTRSSKKKAPPLRKYDTEQPIIVILDSLGLSHPAAVRNLKDYLIMEGKTKRSRDIELKDLKGMTAKGVPQQENFCDCGLYLLGYVAKFMKDPKEFLRKILTREFNEFEDWPDLRPPKMRAAIRELCQKLAADQARTRKDKRLAAKAKHEVSKKSAPLTEENNNPRPAISEELAGDVPPQSASHQDATEEGEGPARPEVHVESAMSDHADDADDMLDRPESFLDFTNVQTAPDTAAELHEIPESPDWRAQLVSAQLVNQSLH